MPFIDTREIEVLEKRPGWRGRIFHSPQMTFAHWEFDQGSTIHEHNHVQEEVWHIVSGELEITIGAETRTVGPGTVAVVPKNVHHSVKALSDGKAIVVDYPLREM